MRKLVVFLKNYKKECLFGPFFKLLEALFELLLPTIMALVINNGVGRHDRDYVLHRGILMACMAVCGYACALACQYLAARASQGFGTDLRNALYEKIAGFSYETLDRFGTPTLINRVTNDVNQLQTWVAMMIRLVIRAPLICIGAIVMSFFLDPGLALILLAATPLFGLIIFLVTKRASPLYQKYQQNLDRMARVLRESLSGVRVIRAFSKTAEENRRFESVNADLTETGLSIGRISAWFNPLTSFTVNAAILAILWAGGIHISTGRLSQGQIIAFINYVNQILYALLVISNLIILLTKSMASAGRVNEILAVPDESDNGIPVHRVKYPNAPAVVFENVSFGYHSSGNKAVEHISVEIQKGETIGIIGGTGSGKSTFVNLLLRFYNAESGNIRINGADIQTYSVKDLRRLIGIVPQKSVLFTGTVRDNIRWGSPNALDADVVSAARIAQADEFIARLPEGYDTIIQRGGMNLSGGQRQRIAIARALAPHPEILILDDAASALDMMTDAKLRRSLRNHCSGMTTVIVSQRVSAIRNTDKILVFDNGNILSAGTHRELLQNCAVYREINRSQFSGEEETAYES